LLDQSEMDFAEKSINNRLRCMKKSKRRSKKLSQHIFLSGRFVKQIIEKQWP